MENFIPLPITLQKIHLDKTETKNQEQATMAKQVQVPANWKVMQNTYLPIRFYLTFLHDEYNETIYALKQTYYFPFFC